jgi:hypothetical protein
VGDCWYRLLDPTAGVRAYVNNGKVRRFWVGFYNGKAIDHYTGAPVAVNVTSASIREHTSYPELYEKAKTAIGSDPKAVVADRGYSISSVFEHNTTRGVASVMPWRRPNGQVVDRAQEDCELHDRHGVVRCKHCGSATRFVRFSAKGRSGPRLWVKCLAQPTAECAKEQTVLCRHNWRMLLPLWRTSETYLALRDSHDRYERVHHHWRTRYRVGADDHALRPKRRGRACQQLRANAALVIEWLIILWREGWLASARRKHRQGVVFIDKGAAKVAALMRRRLRYGLEQPYGPKAVALGIGSLAPTPGRSTNISPDNLGPPENEP